MISSNDQIDLLEENHFQWQQVSDYMARGSMPGQDIEKIRRLATASPYALQQLQQHPEYVNALLTLEKLDLEEQIFDQNPVDKIDLDQLKSQLRQYRHRKLVEIIFLDVVKSESVETILRHLSDLADRLIAIALHHCEASLSRKHGQPLDAAGSPMELNIIAMGKLGGRELNFSSDIDLICCYESDGELSGLGQLSYREYFSRVVRLLSQVLAETTAQGFVYRVDLRLRPWGESGPVALSHSALEHYYQLHGREWEQYAMVKARVLTGSESTREELASMLRPFVYRKYHDYRVFEGLATLKGKIDSQARSRAMKVNIKVGQGGIREIEFFVQAFQILKGGRNHQLQTTGIFDSFDGLEKYQIVDTATLQPLRAAYCFMRLLENRIQMFEDMQTHDLPDNRSQQKRIALTMGYQDWDQILGELALHREQVSRCFNELFKLDTESTPELVLDIEFSDLPETEQRWDFIEQAQVADTEAINHSLNLFLRSKGWGFMSARAKKRFTNLLPDLLGTLRDYEYPGILFERFMRLFSSIAGRSVYFELLYQNPALLEKLASLFERSTWIAEEVSQYPMLLENLLHSGDEQRFDKPALLARLQQQLNTVAGDTELELDSLRLFKREQTLVIATAELAQEIDAIQVGRYLSELAEVVLEAVYQLARQALQQQFGDPECVDQGVRRKAHFAIIGYGKLGGHELHYQSDLDVIFLHDSCGEQQQTDGSKSIENSVYFARLAQKVISLTSVLTASGKLYEIDSRLRPEGSSGLLVSSIEAYLRYQLEKAWTWEHQALVRARFVAGDMAIETQFTQIREQVLKLPREQQQLRHEITEMRERIYQNKKPPQENRMDLKQSRGGMVDIEFLVQYWVLSQANNIGSDCLYSDNIRLLETLFRLNLITSSQSKLVEIYQTYHRLLHESVLQNQSAEIDAELVTGQVKQVLNCWDECFSQQEN